MKIFNVSEEQKNGLMSWLFEQKSDVNLNQLANNFLEKGMEFLAKFESLSKKEETKPQEEPAFEDYVPENFTPDFEEEVVPKEPVIAVEILDTPTDFCDPVEPKEPTDPKVFVETVDPVQLANAEQLMEIFAIPEEKKDDLIAWLKTKNSNDMGLLMNSYLDENIAHM